MLIVCPQCAPAYEVDRAALGPDGRRVRCARCMTIWRAAPRDAQPIPAEIVPRRAAADATEAVGDTERSAPASPPTVPVVIAQAPSLVPADGDAGQREGDGRIIEPRGEDIETLAARRGARKVSRRHWRPPSLPTVIGALAACLAAFLAGRTAVVRAFPQTASLFIFIHLPVNLRGLDFADVKSSEEFDQDVPVLVVEGRIVNLTNRIMDVPRPRLAVRNAAGQEVYAWTALAQTPILGPRDSLPFRTRLASPPSEANEVAVRFFTKRDRMAGFH